MGGGTCIGFSCTYPERVSALVVADSLHGLVESEEVAVLMDEARAATDNLSQIERVLGQRVRQESPEAEVLYRQINSFNDTDKSNLTGAFKRFEPAELGATGLPILFIAGDEDVLFPIEAIRKAQEQVIGSFLVEVYQTGHSAFFESPTEFNDSVLSTLQMAGLKPANRSAHSNAPGYERVL